ncbi:S8 family serine peptidase [Riemerella anatipestifer]|nr:S8 family serine peptidase [Riemerella anatipestifer]MDY3534178.1 S8 family serine peptidase [Riemerella anatipestifer]MDY3536255.1 S8 family serine peptidase [Riemerella anatipestifer]
MKKRLLFTGAFTLGVSVFFFAQTEQQRLKIAKEYNQQKLDKIVNESKLKEQKQKAELAEFLKTNNLPLKIQHKEGGVSELIRVENGVPIYFTNNNVAAAKSTRANHLNTGGSLGLQLDGQGMAAYVWDAGSVRPTHREVVGRVTIKDRASSRGDNHSTHVGGTIAASGVAPAAKGMASKALINSYDWTSDYSEASTAAGAGMLLSNHSYGYNSLSLPDWYFGAYIGESADWDRLMCSAPYYLMCVAAGNDGSNYGYNQSTGKYELLNASPLGGTTNDYDKLTGHATSKNALVVANANDADVDAQGNILSPVTIAPSSSQGPTDDLRIKPDISGNGVQLYSSVAYTSTSTANTYGDAYYDSYTGTSMATPNVTGSLLLVQQHYNSKEGQFMLGAQLKGLALHTADDAGMEGPDANFGWGLLNVKRMVETINSRGVSSSIENLNLANGTSYTKKIVSDGVTPIKVSISWYDPAGAVQTSSELNGSAKRLVNDLDLRVTSSNGTTYFPWALTSRSTNAKKDNNSDNFERVDLGVVPAGEYTVSISHKGVLTNSRQNYTLIVTGANMGGSTTPTPTPTVCGDPSSMQVSNVTSSTATVSWTASSSANVNYTLQYKLASSSSWVDLETTTSTSVALTSLSADTAYDLRVRTNCSSTSMSNYASISFRTAAAVVTSCNGSYEPNNSFSAATRITALNTDYNAAIETTTDKDYYVLTTGTAGYVTVKLSGLTHDIDLRLYNSSGTQIKSSLNSGTTSELIQAYLAAGTYYVLVSPYSGSSPNTCYTLRLEPGYTRFAEGTVDMVSSSNDFKVYPNPVTDVAYVDVPEKLSKNATIKVYDMTGRMVIETKAEAGVNKLNVSNLATGAYVVNVENDLETVSSKFIKK